MKLNACMRREFLRYSLTGATAVALGDRLRTSAVAADNIVVADPGGEWTTAAISAYYGPFEKTAGAKLTHVARPSLAMGQLKAMVESHNVQWDATVLTDFTLYSAAEQDLLQPIDYSQLDTAGVTKGALMKYGVGCHSFATLFAYNTKKWPPGKGPRTWADFWDVKRFPGRRSMGGIGYGPMEFALLADGVPQDKIYPLDIDRALKKMNEIRPHIDVWWTTGAQQSQLMRDGEVDIIQGWNSRLYNAISQGAPFSMEWNQGSYQFEGWVIPKGAPNAEAALKFVAFALKPEQQAAFAENLAVGPSNERAFNFISKARREILPTYGPNLKKLFQVDARWGAQNLDRLTAAWTKWRAA